jgi:hypothetical protein
MVEARDAEKSERERRQDKSDDAAFLKALDRLMTPPPGPFFGERPRRGKKAPPEPTPPRKSQVQEQAKLSPARASRACLRLIEDGVIEEIDVTIWVGKHNKTARQVKGVRRKNAGGTTPTTPTESS